MLPLLPIRNGELCPLPPFSPTRERRSVHAVCEGELKEKEPVVPKRVHWAQASCINLLNWKRLGERGVGNGWQMPGLFPPGWWWVGPGPRHYTYRRHRPSAGRAAAACLPVLAAASHTSPVCTVAGRSQKKNPVFPTARSTW